jgi:hypothetical protein
MKPIIYILLIFSLLTACAPLTPPPDAPVSSDETPVPGSETPQRPSLPLPKDTALERAPAFLDSADLLVLESFPPQYMLSLAGSLPTPCHQLRVAISPPDAENVIAVAVYSLVDPNMICIQVLQSFTENINLGSFPPGKYTVQIDGGPTLEFDAP